jgi:hypothetical protein
MKRLIICCGIIACSIGMLRAQSQSDEINEYIDAYLGINAVPYLQPLADLYAANIHTGLWNRPGIPRRPTLMLKLQGMASFPNDDMRSFQGTTTGEFEPQTTTTVPTIIGDKGSVILIGDNEDFYVFPGGFDLQRIILGTPQLTLSGILHSEINLRFLTFPLEDDQGQVNFFGIGGRHAITNHFRESPVDFTVGYFYHHTIAGSYLDSEHHIVSGTLGRSGTWGSVHIGLGYQTSDAGLDYVYVDGENEYDAHVDISNGNYWIWEAGAGLKMGPLFINGAFSYAQFPTVALGLGLSF